MDRRVWLGPSLIVVLAVVVRLGAVAADGGYVPAHDAFDYHRHARSIAAGEGYPESGYVPDGGPTALRPPAYPHLLGGIYALTGDSIVAGRILGAALGALSVGLLYLLVLSIWGRRVALVAAAGAAVFPPLVLLSRELLSEQLFLVLELGAVLCVLRLRDGGALRWAAAAGLLAGLAALTRNPGAALLVPIALGAWTSRPSGRWRSLLAPATVVACASLVLLPWTVRNALEFGRPIPVSSSSGFAMAGTYNDASLHANHNQAAWRTPVIVPEYGVLFRTEGIDEATLDSTLRREAIDFAWDHPGYVAEATGRNLLRLFELSGGSVVEAGDRPVEERGIGSGVSTAERIGLAAAVALAGFGIWAIVGGGAQRGPYFVWLVPLLAVLMAAPVAGLPRYRIPADPFLLVLAAIGLIWLWDAFLPRRPRTA